MKTNRHTIEKQIDSELDPTVALGLALYGRTFTPIQRETWQYLRGRQYMRDCIKAGMREDHQCRKAYTEATIGSMQCMLQSILTAIDTGDSGKLREVADLVDWNRGDKPEQRGIRAHMVILKGELNRRGARMTIERLAALLNYRETEDNYASLRKLCKRMKFPLATRPPGRPKRETHKRK